MNSYEYLKKLIFTQIDSRLTPVCMAVLDDRAFREGFASPSHKEGHPNPHHNYPGGLMIHTAEVMNIALATATASVIEVNREVIVAGVIYHDYLKIRDYDTNGNETDYKKLIYHPQGSYTSWVMRASEAAIPQSMIDAVGHVILSHHGQRAWKAAVEPQTVEAVIVHQADMLSSHFGKDKAVARDNF